MTMDSQRSTPDELVMRLLDLAREASTDDLSPREHEGLRRLERTVLHADTPAQRSPWLRFGWLALAPAAAAIAVGVYAMRERALTFEVVSGKVSDGGYVSANSGDAKVHFSDHSDLGLESGTRLRISNLEVRGARVMLEGGTMHVSIHTKPHGNWTLDAGPYIVHVTGTEFDLAWRDAEQTLDLRLHKGSVVVEGPLANAGLRMAAGQHLVANANTGTLSLMDDSTPAAPPPSTALGPSSPAPPSGPATFVVQAPPAGRTGAASLAARSAPPAPAAHAEEQAWGARVAHGDFDSVIADAERRGIDRVLAESSAVDLASLADAARYARRQDVARRALLSERSRYPGSLQARDAPFFLGGIAEAEHSDAAALDWYDTYLSEGAYGAYASQALGRKLILVQRLRGTEAARPIASEYMARFPDGPYASFARKLLQSP